jgi:hypothetical protein
MKGEHFKKLGINIAVLVLFGVLVWVGYRLFTHSFGIDPIIGVVVFVACAAGWILLIRLTEGGRYRWVRPSLALTTFCVIAVILTLSFAGVQPLSGYKDVVIDGISARLGAPGTSLPGASPIPYGVYCDLLELSCINLGSNHLYSTNIYSLTDVEAGTYSVSDDFITLTDEATHEVRQVRYTYSKSTKYLYLYPYEWSSEPTTFFVHR